MADLPGSPVYFTVGVAFENVWLEKIAAVNPEMKLGRTDRGIQRSAMISHEHGPESDKIRCEAALE